MKMKMKYEHNEAHDKKVGEIVRGGFECIGFVCKDCDVCPINKKCEDDDFFNTEKTKQAVIEYIAEEVAEFLHGGHYKGCDLRYWANLFTLKNEGEKFNDKYPVDLQTAKEIADAARVLLEGEKAEENPFADFQKAVSNMAKTMSMGIELKEDQPTTADAFYVYNGDLEKCITVSREQGDDIIDITIHNEMDIATARVFCEKLSSFLRSIGGEK